MERFRGKPSAKEKGRACHGEARREGGVHVTATMYLRHGHLTAFTDYVVLSNSTPTGCHLTQATLFRLALPTRIKQPKRLQFFW